MLVQTIYQNLGRQFSVTLELIHMAFDEQLRQVTDLSAMHVILLMLVKCNQWMPLNKVMQDTGYTKPVLDVFLEPLFTRTLLDTIEKEDGVGLVLTVSGQTMLEELWPVIDKTGQKIVQDFSMDEKNNLMDYIARIQDNCYTILSQGKQSTVIAQD